MPSDTKTFFAPQLIIPRGVRGVDFYIDGLGAVEVRRFSNEDGSVHVSELSIDGCLFHLHEQGDRAFPPAEHNGVTAVIGLFVDDVDAVIARATSAGAVLRSPARDFDYGYRQAEIIDPYGHRWLIEKRI